MKNKKIEIPDYSDIEILEDEDLIKLGDSLLEALKKKLGTTKLFVVYKWSNNIGYEVVEVSAEDICFSRESFGRLTELNINGVYGTIYYIFKNKDKAQKYCDTQNIDIIKKNIETLKQEIDECNPIKAMEKAEKEKEKLIKRCLELKEKLQQIEGGNK